MTPDRRAVSDEADYLSRMVAHHQEAVQAGFQVMTSMMEEAVTALCGPRGKHTPQRTAVRHGSEAGSVVLGGRKVPIRRPRVRTADGGAEVAIPAYELFSSADVLEGMALDKMLGKISTRRYWLGLEPVGSTVEAAATGTSKSAISRRFIAATEHALADLRSADLSHLDLVALMIDGVHFGEHTCIVALGIGIDGTKHPLALVEGSTENATLATELIVGLRERGLNVTAPILVVLDGSKALRKAVMDVFDHPVIGRCQLHKIRNVRDKLLRLDVPPTLARTLLSTNPIESMISICRDHATNVKRWQGGQMALRWCAAGMTEAGKQFRRVNGFLHLPKLRQALQRHVTEANNATECYNENAA
ncbi:transposase [Nonomuraea angiospora]